MSSTMFRILLLGAGISFAGSSFAFDAPKPRTVLLEKRSSNYSHDERVRTVPLLNQSEDLKQMKAEWRRFWFNDHPLAVSPHFSPSHHRISRCTK